MAKKQKAKAHLIVREIETDEEVRRIALTSLGERRTEKVISGLLRKMDTDRFYVDESEVDAARAAEAKA